MATLIKVDGSTEEIRGKNPDGSLTLRQMQEIVGGYIQIIPTTNGEMLVCDEEGKLKDKKLNMKASGKVELFPTDYIAGDAILLSRKEIH